MKTIVAILIALLCTSTVYADDHEGSKVPVTATASASQHQSQTATSSSSSSTSQTQTATGGASSSSANNTGNSQTSNVATNVPQQAPAIGQGSFAIAGCASAGNAGGANTHGAMFLGFGFTTHDCYLFYQAAAYQALGKTQTACEVLNHTHTMQKLHKDEGVALADCGSPHK